ncbi:MAG TPA: hypothetical protein VHD91_04600 [Gaiellaceae bacterium]|nr:hypothetical protein [Gaiellaceae bacterium]
MVIAHAGRTRRLSEPAAAQELAVRLGTGLALVAVLTACGLAVVRAPAAAGLLVGLVVAGFVAADWRRGVGILVVVLAFAGLPVFLINSKYAPVLKDLFVVVPVYAGFFGSRIMRREPLWPRGDALTPLLLLFASMTVVYSLVSPTPAVAAIGLKVWLLYIPLYGVGYAYVRGREDVIRIVRSLAIVAVVPVLLALVELFYFIQSGGFGPLLSFYGRFSSGIVRQVGFGVTVPRIPSTFTFNGSYYDFAFVAFMAGLAYWGYRRTRLSAALALVAAAGALVSGERRAYITIPVALVAAVALMGSGSHTRLRVALAGFAGIVALSWLGIPILDISNRLSEGTVSNINAASQQLEPALKHGFFGHGTGSGTNAAFRYSGLSPSSKFAESWYTKALVELGYFGVAVVLAIMVVLVRRGYGIVRGLSPPDRALAAPIWVLLFLTALLLAKASELDWDPLDAYFWLFAGMLSGLGAVAGDHEGRTPDPER